MENFDVMNSDVLYLLEELHNGTGVENVAASFIEVYGRLLRFEKLKIEELNKTVTYDDIYLVLNINHV